MHFGKSQEVQNQYNIMKKITVTIGIPAYNEEKNIARLLGDLLRQKVNGCTIEKIIVSSDKSTDATDLLVKKFRNKKIQLISNIKREGQAVRQNQIISHVKSDILVFLNADIRIHDKYFLKKIITPIFASKADLTSCTTKPLPARGFIERVLNTSVKIKQIIFETYKRGNNIYTCHGRARAFSKKLYQAIFFKKSVGEDAYSYLFCVSNNFRYQYVRTTKVFYRLPTSINDHKKQSIRFLQTQKLLTKYFGEEITVKEYKLPFFLIIKSFTFLFLKEPLNVISFIVIFSLMKVNSFFNDFTQNTWNVSGTSKILVNK